MLSFKIAPRAAIPFIGAVAALGILLCAANAAAQQSLPQNLDVQKQLQRGNDPLNSFRPPAGGSGSGSGGGSMLNDFPEPEEAPPTVARRDQPREAEPMEDYTQYFQKKVFRVPEARAGQTLTYFWREPASADKSRLYPLIVVLHNDKGIAHAAEYLLRKQIRTAFPAFVAVPALPAGQIWTFPTKFPDDPLLENKYAKRAQALPNVVKLVQDLQQSNGIDPQRIYVIGCGEGGFGAFGAALNNSDIFAAAVPISGGWTVKDAPKLTKFPLFVMHGSEDKVFKPGLSRNVAYYIQQFGGRRISFVEVPGMANDCSNPLLYGPATWQWMFSQKRK